MLSRAVLRSLRSPAVQITPTTFRIASSTAWTRGLARHNRPNHGPKKPIDYSRPPGSPTPTRSPGAGPASGVPQQTARTSDKHGRPDIPKSPGELTRNASPEWSSVPQSEYRGSGISSSASGKNDPAFSSRQEQPETTASFTENTTPKSTSPSAIDFGKLEVQGRPLPDLTQGIPSTLEYETTGSTSGSRGLRLNLTEAEETDPSGSGRGRGELPASAYISSSERKRLKVANYMYAMFAALSIGGTIYLGRNWETEEEENKHPQAASGWALGLMWNRAKARLGDQLNYYNEPAFRKLLPDPDPLFERPYTLILSLEDLLIHSEWSREHGWRMAKRPGVDYFLRYLSQYYELVIFTSQPWAVAEPVIRKLDPYHIVTWPLFREATLYENGEYVKVRPPHLQVLHNTKSVPGSFVSEP